MLQVGLEPERPRDSKKEPAFCMDEKPVAAANGFYFGMEGRGGGDYGGVGVLESLHNCGGENGGSLAGSSIMAESLPARIAQRWETVGAGIRRRNEGFSAGA